MRRVLALVLAVSLLGCPHTPPTTPTPADAGTSRCPPAAAHTPEGDVCIVLPTDYQLVRKEQEPAFDRRTYGYNRPGDRPAEIRLELQWFPKGRDRAAQELDYASEVATLQPDGGDLEFDSSTDDGNGRFLRVRARANGGELNEARALVRTPHYRVRCAVDQAGAAESAVLDACRTLSAPE